MTLNRTFIPSHLPHMLFLLFLMPCLLSVLARAQVTFNGASSVNMRSQAVGSTSAVVPLSFTIGANTTVGSIAVLTTGIAGKDFAQATGSTCTATTYTTTTKCLVNVTFTPLATGLRRGAVVFYSGASKTSTALATVPVFGVGTGPQVVFSPSGAATTVGSKFMSPHGGLWMPQAMCMSLTSVSKRCSR